MPLPVNTGVVTFTGLGTATHYADEQFICAAFEDGDGNTEVLLDSGRAFVTTDAAADVAGAISTYTSRTSSLPDGRALYIVLENIAAVLEHPENSSHSLLYFRGGHVVECGETAKTIRDAIITARGGVP